MVTVGTPSTCLSGGNDCDDNDASRHPGALEVCDGVDQDCDATADDGLATLDYALDVDLDNFYVTSSVVSSCSPPSSLHRQVSVMVSNGGGAGDCDDSRASVHPLAVEQCDNLDNDCSSSTAIDFTCDDDNDGYCDFSLVTVGTPSTCLSGGGDCDDDRSSVFPGATEVCDGMRNNCSSSSIPSGELDDDGDGYVECAFVAATWGGSVLVFGGNDCDDLSASRHPGATETCDGVDQDCDASVDEGSNVFYRDLDSDGYGDLVVSVSLVCTSPPSGFVVTPGDCDDTRLLYADVDGDGIGAGAPTACGVQTNTDNCPTVQGQVGSSCSDGNPSTTGDVLTASCQCVGTTTVTCTQNAVSLSLTTDAFGSQTSYDIVASGSTTAVCSGSGLVSGSTLTASCCLPNGCYDLRVFDSFGDGMALPGGFVLRDASSNRIIDNAGNGHGFSVISQSPLGFCVPLGTDRLMPTSCDVVNATTNTVLRAELNPTVTSLYSVGHPNNAITGYQFWITNPNGGFSRRIVLTHAAPGTGAPGGTPAAQKASFFKLSSMSSTPPAIPLEILLNVRVRAYIAGAYSEFGPACRLYLPPVPCQTTQLTTTADPVVSCGASGLVFSSVIYSTALSSATGYQFEFSKPGYLRRINSATRSVPLSFITVPLQYNSCYRVRVRVSFDGGLTYCPFGPYCNITLGTATCASGMALEDGTDGSSIADEARLSIWPNPNDGSLMNISFTGFDPTVSTVQVDVADIFGKLVSTRTIPVQDGYLNTAMSFEQQPAPGLYLVQLQAGDQRLTQRLVIE